MTARNVYMKRSANHEPEMKDTASRVLYGHTRDWLISPWMSFYMQISIRSDLEWGNEGPSLCDV